MAKTDKSPWFMMISTLADTTWRMFVPTIGLLGIGWLIDQKMNSWPWAALGGLLLGSVIAGLLIRKLLKNDT